MVCLTIYTNHIMSNDISKEMVDDRQLTIQT